MRGSLALASARGAETDLGRFANTIQIGQWTPFGLDGIFEEATGFSMVFGQTIASITGRTAKRHGMKQNACLT